MAQVQVPPPPPESWIQEFIRLNPKASRITALNEAAIMVSEDTGQSPTLFLTQWLGQEPGRMLGAAYQAAVPGIEKVIDLGLRGGVAPPNPFSSGLARLVTPQTLTQAGMMAAAGPVSRIGAGAKGVMAGAKALGSRIGAMTGVGAVGETVTGGDPLAGGMGGALAQTIGEAVRFPVGVAKGVKYIQQYKTMLADATKDAQATLGGILQQVPWFAPAAVPTRAGDTAANALYRISEHGEKMASEGFKQIDQLVTTTLGGPRALIPLPSLNPGATRWTPAKRMPVEKALQELKVIRARARKAPPGADGFAIREQARAFADDIYAALHRANPQVEAAYKQAAVEYREAMLLSDGLRASGAFEGPIQAGKGATFDGGIFLKWLQANRDDIPYDKFKSVYDALLRGAHPGAADVIGLAPRVRGYFGQGISGTTPNIRFMRQPRGGWETLPPSMIPPGVTAGAANTVSGLFIE